MLAEFLADRGDWTLVMPGARACLFSLDKWSFRCLSNWNACTLKHVLHAGISDLNSAGRIIPDSWCQQVLILTDLTDLAGASVDAPVEGVLVAVDAAGARESLESICKLLGGLTLDTGRVRRWMSAGAAARWKAPRTGVGQPLPTWTVFPK